MFPRSLTHQIMVSSCICKSSYGSWSGKEGNVTFFLVQMLRLVSVAYVELNELLSHVVWELVSTLKKAEGESFSGWCGSEDGAQTGC